MAVTIEVTKNKRGQIPTNGGLIHATITVTSGTAYATASGGFAGDLTTVLAELNHQNGGLTIDNVLGIASFGADGAGYLFGQFAKTTDNGFTVRQWLNNGSITERADGSSWTSTAPCLILVSPHA